MADEGIFATTDEVIRKAGVGASVVSATELFINDYMTQAESEINVFTRKNWSDLYSSLNLDTRGILKMVASNLAAIYVVAYDFSGYDSRIEAEDIINVLRDNALRGMSILRDMKQKHFLESA